MSALPLTRAFGPRAFVELDERLVGATSPDRLVVRAPRRVHDAVMAHAARRLRAGGWRTFLLVPTGAPLFVEVAARLGLAAPSEEAACAAAIASHRIAVVAPRPAPGSWDEAVAAELARHALLVLLLTEDDADDAAFEVGAELGGPDKVRWLSAIAEEAQAELAAHDLGELERWWARARLGAPSAPPSEGAHRLRHALVVAGRALSRDAVCALGLAAHVDELVVHGLARASEGFVAALPGASGVASTWTCDVRAVADHLLGVPDPWAQARAAELFAGEGEVERADEAIARALRHAEPRVADELGTRWFDVVEPISGAPGLTLRLRAAERALAVGEAAAATRWCASAARIAPADPLVDLLHARALAAQGDVVAARICLERAERSSDGDLRARIVAERAETAWLAGELDAAAALASDAGRLATTPATVLAARSTLGKVLLARGAFAEAETHFAEDALAAAAAGERVAELRARTNRAIALLSRGELVAARTMLEAVLEDGVRHGEDRAQAQALSNLGLVAYRQRDYGAALRFWEETIRFPQALRGRISTALTIGNLAELRLRFGLVEHAEHAIAFGRRLAGPKAPARTLALFAWVAALAALARGDTEAAKREAEQALALAQTSGDRHYLESAFLVATRVALEEGDRERTRTMLLRAEAAVKTPRARAELALVRALALRALGQPAIEPALEALELAADEEELLLEIHALCATLHRDGGDAEGAERHAAEAMAMRDRIAASLPPDVRAAFLAKPELAPLARMPEPPSSRRPPTSPVTEMVGDDPQIRALVVAIRKVARTSSTVLVRGESGTGKELVAAALHRASDRANGPLVSVNCAALVETLLLSELFGHERGAFTGASSRRRGRFELAEGGTLFLDEIGDISPRTQVALLRVLQEKTFERVGGTTPLHANVRVVCATHRDLRAMVERGEFREDLYYRLRGITLEVPPLRARLGDLPRIAEHLLARIAGSDAPKRLASDALELLVRHRWPGNVRELENVLRAAAVFTDGDVIGAADLALNVDELRSLASQRPVSVRSIEVEDEGELPDEEANATAVAYAQVRQGAVSLSDLKRQIERDCIARALGETRGNITRAAALLGMKRPRLSQLVKQYGFATTPEGGS